MRHRHSPKRNASLERQAHQEAKRAMLDVLMHRDCGCCVWCRRAVDRARPTNGRRPPANMATMDHVIPESDGGAFTRTNLVLACADCNQDRGRTPALAFAEQRGVVLPAEVVAMLEARAA